jgi:hypothetical protein
VLSRGEDEVPLLVERARLVGRAEHAHVLRQVGGPEASGVDAVHGGDLVEIRERRLVSNMT